MWAEGSIKIENSIFHYWVKHYEEPSEDYGIDGGRISKLMLKRNDEIVTTTTEARTSSRSTKKPKWHLPF